MGKQHTMGKYMARVAQQPMKHVTEPEYLSLLLYQLYGNCWVTGQNHWLSIWGKDQVSPGSTGEGNSPVRPEGVEPGCISPRPHLRADCHWGRISFWGSFPLEFSAVSLGHGWAFHLSLIVSFHHNNLSDYKTCKILSYPCHLANCTFVNWTICSMGLCQVFKPQTYLRCAPVSRCPERLASWHLPNLL